MSDTEKRWYGIYRKQPATNLLNGPYGAIQDEAVAKGVVTDVARAMFGEDAVIREINPDHLQLWGVGNATNSKSFATTLVGNQEVELIHGEHPHGRSDNNIYARYPDGRIEAFDGHRLLHEISFIEHNYLKESELSGDEIRKGGKAEIKINGVVVNAFFFRDIREALLRALRHLDDVESPNLPFRLWNKKECEKLVGRKVYWHDHPAVITRYIEDQACVILEPEGKPFPPVAYEMEQGLGMDHEDWVKEDIYSPHIWWYRN